MPRTRLTIDALMLLFVATLARIGFLLKNVFVSGHEARMVCAARVDQLV